MSNSKLQKVQNTTALITLWMSRTGHVTSFLSMLHWLPISYTYKTDSCCNLMDYSLIRPKHSQHYRNIYHRNYVEKCHQCVLILESQKFKFYTQTNTHAHMHTYRYIDICIAIKLLYHQ